MSKKFQLHIAEPCHENWDNMSPVEKGRFCDSCQKQVVDFSTMSDREIVQFFKKPSTGSVCGRFMNDQLERDMVIEKKRLPWIKYFFQFFFPAFAISKQAYAQGLIKVSPVVNMPLANKGNTQLKESSSLSELKVIVTDSATHLPIPYASVKIISINTSSVRQGASTEADGSLVVQIKNNEAVDLEISSAGYKTETIKILPADLHNSKVIKAALRIDVKELPEVTVVSYGVQGLIRMSTGYATTIHKADTTRTNNTEDKVLPLQSKTVSSKIFPNPLPQTQTATIEINSEENDCIYAMITDAAGKMIAMQKWNAVKGVNHFTVDATPKMLPGIYFIRLTNEKGKLIRTERLIIQ